MLPKDIPAGERRPVVVCQHGRDGLPRKTIDEGNPGYSQVAARLAERGFIAFSPHNLYRGEDRYRWLSRKANTIQASLFSFIIPQHDAILSWLRSLPQVHADSIAFYGLSYGGETAVRVPSILEKYALSICSGDFNQWTRKVASTSEPFSFMRTIEWEMPYWNLGHTLCSHRGLSTGPNGTVSETGPVAATFATMLPPINTGTLPVRRRASSSCPGAAVWGPDAPGDAPQDARMPVSRLDRRVSLA